MMIVPDVKPLPVPQGIVQMHGAAADHGKAVRDSVPDKEISDIIGKSLFHAFVSFTVLIGGTVPFLFRIRSGGR